MKKVFGIFALLALLAIAPQFASAQYIAGGTTWFDLATVFYKMLKWIGPVLVLVAATIFSANIIRYLLLKEKPDEKKEALKSVGWSIIGIFAMLSLWGVIAILSGLGIGVGGKLSSDLIPQVQTCDPFAAPGTPGC